MQVDVKIKYISKSENIPKYATKGSLGLDLVASIDCAVVVHSLEVVSVGTGIYVQIPNEFGGFIFARSGLSYKNGITLVNGVGVIDNDYTGEVKIPLINLSDKDYTILPGDRIAQMIVLPVAFVNLIREEFEDTDRGDSGFGSSGR